jgi:sugar/nucleoside kinase (ribokinase family)
MAEVALACGHVTLDRFPDGSVSPGGSAWYAARAWRALGARARIVTGAGPDFPRAALAGVEAEIAPASGTTRFVNRTAPDGARVQRVEGVAPPLEPALLPAAWRTADVLLLAPVLGEIDLRAWAGAVRARATGIGVQGWVRAGRPDGTVEQPRWDLDPAALAGVQAAFVGEDDVRGQGDLVARLARVVPVVVFTHGAAGCEVVSAGRTRRVGVYATREVDPTGAGDVFSAGFLLALARGADPVEAARLGAAAASVIVEDRGGGALDRLGEAFDRAREVASDADFR